MNSRKDADRYYHEGQFEKRGKQFKRAIVNFTRAIKLDKSKWTCFFETGLCFAKQNEFNKACFLYKNALILNSQEDMIYFNFAAGLRALGKMDESMEIYRQVIHLNPNDAEAHYNLAIILTTKEKYEEAQKHFTETLRLNHSLHFKIYNCLGYLYFLQGEFSKAIIEFQKSIHSWQKYMMPYCNLSLVLFCEKRNQEAEDVFDEGLKTLQEGENRAEVIKGIINNYSNEKARLEKKLSENEETMTEEKVMISKTLINGLVELLNLFAQQRNPEKEKKFLYILAYVPEENLDLYS